MTTELSLAQQGILAGEHMYGQGALYMTAECLAFTGRIDSALLQRALQQSIREADCLSCVYRLAPHGANFQGIRQPCTVDLPWQEIALSQGQDREYFSQFAATQLKQPFDLENEIPIRFVFFRAPTQDYLVTISHHIALDGYGLTVFFRRVASLYSAWQQDCIVQANTEPACPFLPFTSLLAEEEQQQSQHAISAAHWQQQYSDWPEPQSFCQEKALMQPGYRRCSQTLAAEQWLQLQTLASEQRLSWPDLLLASISATLELYTGQQQQVLGLIMMNRVGSSALQIPCMNTNMVPLFTNTTDQSWISLAQQISQQKRRLRAHQHYRYEMLKRDLHKVAAQDRLWGPLVNIMPFDHAHQFGAIAAHTMPLLTGAVDDVMFEIYLSPNQPPLIDIAANPHSYSDADVEQLMHVWQSLLTLQLQNPMQPLQSLNRTYVAQWRHDAIWQAPDPILPARTRSLFEQLTAFWHDFATQPAVTSQQHRWNYAELAQQISQYRLGLRLQISSLSSVSPYHDAPHRHIETTTPRVALLLSRQPQSVALMLACIAEQLSFVMLDPQQPPARLQQQLQLTAPRLLVHDDSLHDIAQACQASVLINIIELAQHSDATDVLNTPITQAANNREIYVLFTSGSSGQPKAVPIHADAIGHFVQAAVQRYGWQPQDRVLQFAPLHFDACLEEMLVSLSVGAQLVLRDDDCLQSMAQFDDFIHQYGITVLDLPTAFFHEWAPTYLAQASPRCHTLRQVIIGGEALNHQLWQQWQQQMASRQQPPIDVINSYGPTETTIVALSHTTAKAATTSTELHHHGKNSRPRTKPITSLLCPTPPSEPISMSREQVPIGLPLPGVQCLILDKNDRPSTDGELILLGPTLAHGYLSTHGTESFGGFQTLVIGEQPTAIYRTGDQVYARDGLIYYQGRSDDEFKLAGYRIVPREIETLLQQHPAVSQAVVLGITEGSQRYLQAWVVPQRSTITAAGVDEPASFDTLTEYPHLVSTLQHALRQQLPAVMVPTKFHVLPSLPRTSNNKIDKQQLRQQAKQSGYSSTADASSLPPEPFTGAAAIIAHIWQQVLGQAPQQLSDNFFQLGGQSLQTIQVVNRLSQQLALHVKVSDAFNHPTLAQFSHFIEQLQQPNAQEELIW